MKFMEDQDPEWVDKHVARVVNIGGATLGAVKGVPALISGIFSSSVKGY